MSRSKLMVITIVSLMALLILSGAVFALGSYDSQQKGVDNGEGEAQVIESAVSQGEDAQAENGNLTRTRNEDEDDLIRITLRSQEQEGECCGDCDRLRLREMDCDPTCDGEGEQKRNNQ